MNNTFEEDEINLQELFFFLKRRIWLIVIIAILFATAAFVVSSYIITPMYKASTRIYVLNQANENTIAYSDLQISSQFVTDYQELITGRNVTGIVISKMGLDMTDEQLKKKIEVTSPANTRIIHITVESKDPKEAAEIANCVREVATEQIQSIMDDESVRLVYAAEVPQKASSPSVVKYTAIGSVLGLFLILAILSVKHLSDCTIRSEEDVERYLSLGVLGTVPVSKNL